MNTDITMNFVNPNSVDGESPYRVRCNFVLHGDAHVLSVYDCPNIKKLQQENVDIRVVFHNKDEVFVFQTEDSAKQLFDKVMLTNICKNCQYRNYARRGSR